MQPLNAVMTNFSLLTFVLVCSVFRANKALKCMTCQGSTSFEDCDVNGRIKECMSNQNSCETVVRRIHKDRQLIFKQCKKKTSCRENELQNTRLSGRSTQCNLDQISSFCTCCCDTDMCNIAAPTCHSSIVKPPAGHDCPLQPTFLSHGKVTCFKDNKPGAVCQYQCSDVDYFVYPVGHETNVCRNNGTWKHETPCCGRSCPPYMVYDFGAAIDVSIPGGRERIVSVYEGFFSANVVAEDAVKNAFVFFGENPIESSVVKFNEYEASASRFIQFLQERAVEKTKESVNIGAALKYTLGHLMTPEGGMRDDRVKKAVAVFTEHISDDDAIGPANEARRLGYVVFVLYMGKEASDLQREHFIEIAGGEDSVFYYDHVAGNFGANSWQFMKDNFCLTPCDHVVHEHDSP